MQVSLRSRLTFRSLLLFLSHQTTAIESNTHRPDAESGNGVSLILDFLSRSIFSIKVDPIFMPFLFDQFATIQRSPHQHLFIHEGITEITAQGCVERLLLLIKSFIDGRKIIKLTHLFLIYFTDCFFFSLLLLKPFRYRFFLWPLCCFVFSQALFTYVTSFLYALFPFLFLLIFLRIFRYQIIGSGLSSRSSISLVGAGFIFSFLFGGIIS